MSTTTPNFGWTVPTSSDLVKNGAVAIETLGDSIDASMADLKGGTTGQVLSKATDTDMDFTWTSAGAASPLTTKGDLYGYSTTNARVPVGTNGQVLTADSTAATGLAWATPSGGTNSFYAGKNRIINGDFNINQRNFTSTTTDLAYGFDRFFISYGGGSLTNSAQTFTAGTAPVAGYEGKNFSRLVTASQSAAGDYAAYIQRIESVRTFAAQTVTVSMWAKASTGTPKIGVSITQDFGIAGSAILVTSPATQTITSSWVRYSFTVAVPSIAGKTIGTSGDNLTVTFWTSAGTTISGLGYPAVGIQNVTIDTWGWQIEAGSTATDFVTASGNSRQAELAMCQRYYFRSTPGTNYGAHGAYGSARTTTVVKAPIPFPVEMRIIPTSVDYSTLAVNDGQNIIAVTTVALSNYESKVVAYPEFTVGSAVLTQYRPYHVNNNNNSAAYLGFSAEL